MSRKTLGIISVVMVALVVVGLVVSTDFLGLLGEEAEPDESRILFDEYVQTFSENLRYEFDVFLDDGVISQDEVNQINFLKQFTLGEQIAFIKSGNHTDFNWDDDNWSNYFEKEISNTPYDIKNDVYVILMTMAGHELREIVDMFYFFEKTLGIPSSNVYDLSRERNNADDFTNSVEELSRKSDGNDVIFIHLGGDGNTGIFAFKDGEIVTYSWFDELLDKVTAKTIVVSIEACYCGSAIPYLESNSKPRIILTHGSAEEKADFGMSYDFLINFQNPLADNDSNGYVSIAESAEYTKEKRTIVDLEDPTNPSKNRHPQISDLNNLGQTSYLVEYRLDG